MAQPTQQPPQAAREHDAVLIVRNNLPAAGDAEAAESPGEHVNVWKGMTSVRTAFGPRQVAIEMRISRTRNVRGRPFPFAPRHIVELETAVHDDPQRVGASR